jgi:hypothetical protein
MNKILIVKSKLLMLSSIIDHRIDYPIINASIIRMSMLCNVYCVS